MATLKEIRKRITSVKNTQKITKAMKMVAAAKLRRAQQAVNASRPYATALRDVFLQVAGKDENLNHPLFTDKPNPRKAVFFIFTSNRGLCGGFNSNLLRRVETFLKSIESTLDQIDIKIIGKKGRDYYKARRRDPSDVFVQYADAFSFSEALELAEKIIQDGLDGVYDEYYLVYNQFKSALSQVVQLEKLVPFSSAGHAKGELIPEVVAKVFKQRQVSQESSKDAVKNTMDFIIEPSRDELLETLVPKYVATQLYKAHLESVASELGARMTAMENASKNAREMIGQLTLEYNRVRQAAITTELMDIVNGSESIK